MITELLAPAGSMEALNAAVSEGADAVYLGLKSFNARMRSSNFTYGEFDAALKAMHRRGKKIYVAVNTVFEQREADRMFQHLQYLNKVGADGIIVQDLGVLQMCRQYFPALKLHASTQMNVASKNGVNLLSKMALKRVVLSRELSFEELKLIRGETQMELEIFVHGSLCVSASGLCMFSSFLGGKSANRGMCTQACRRLYKTDEDDEGKYYFSPNDLCLIEKIPSLVKLGINSFKIEGRMKSAEYCGTVVRAYRKVIDACQTMDADDAITENAIIEASEILKNDFAREKTTFHFDDKKYEPWLNPDQDGGTGIKLGVIKHVKILEGISCIEVQSKAKMHVGDSIRLHKTDDSARKSFKVKELEYKKDFIFITVLTTEDFIFRSGDTIYIIQTKEQSRRYPSLLARNASFSTLKPGYDKAPVIRIRQLETQERAHKRASKVFPKGVYVSISNITDMYIVQSMRPVALIVQCGLWNLRKIANGKNMPFKNEDTIISLDPFFPESVSKEIGQLLDKLVFFGYNRFIVNNLGQISLFANKNVTLVGGPYLYTFNRFSVSFLQEAGLQYFVNPLEISRQNLERVFEEKERQLSFVTIFAYPHLFYIPGDIKNDFEEYKGLNEVRDGRKKSFFISSEDGFSAIIPDVPFSITDKVPFLKEAGFNKFIVDFSGKNLKKNEYKKIIKAAEEGTLILGAARFNYKDGFFQPIDKVEND